MVDFLGILLQRVRLDIRSASDAELMVEHLKTTKVTLDHCRFDFFSARSRISEDENSPDLTADLARALRKEVSSRQ